MILRPLDRNNKVIFFHIVKTGGMTFRSILSSVYGKSFHVCNDPAISAIKKSLAMFDCLEFHTRPYKDDWIHLHAELTRERRWDLLDGMHVFTMLRDPVDQYLSNYYYIVSLRASIEPVLNSQGISFPESLEEFVERPGAYNTQLEFLSGRFQRTGGFLNQGDLAEVKQVLLRLNAHIGLTERFADSVRVFESVTGRRVPRQKVRIRNHNPSRPALEETPEWIKETIRERSALDLELYRFGQQIFAQDVAQCSSTRAFSFSNTAPAVGLSARLLVLPQRVKNFFQLRPS